MIKTCYLRTHYIKLKRNIPTAHININNEINKAINDGYTRFVTGIGGEADIIFAEIVNASKKFYPNINLEIQIPNIQLLEKLKDDCIFSRLFEICDAVSVLRDNPDGEQPQLFDETRYIDL